jgi:hypothetical protein
MFDIDNHEQIQLYVSKRKEGAIVIPMYVSQYGKRYELTELDQIHDYCPGTLRIGFGSCDSVLEKNPFPMKSIYEVDVISVFTQHDDIKNVDVKYIVFETTGLSGDGPLYEQIDVYVRMLNEYIEKSVKSYRQSLAKAFLNEE